MRTRTITLSEPIKGPKGDVPAVILREPRWNDVMPVGAPFEVHKTADGARFVVEDHTAIAHYATACCVQPENPDLLEQLGVLDTMKVREAVLDFFTPGAPASPTTSSPSPDSSSAPAASTPPTSEASPSEG